MENLELEKDEFVGFLLLFAANMDIIIESEEKEFIKAHLTNDKFSKINKLFKKCSDNDCIELIEVNIKKYYTSDKEKEILINEVVKLLSLDEKFFGIEQHFVNSLRRIIF